MPEITKVSYTHDAIIEEILVNPAISQGELSQRFGYTQGWMSIILNSDAFKERLAERKGELTDPKLVASINERLDAIARRSLDKIISRLDMDYPMKTSELIDVAKLGVGAGKTGAPGVQQNLYVMNIPAPASTAQEWLSSSSSPRPAPKPFIDV